MKVRQDFVTNSSSSSFVISKDDIAYDMLIDVLVEIANIEQTYRWDDIEKYESYDEIAYRYEIHEGTKESPYEDYNGWGDSFFYDNHYIVDNNSCIRYDWDAVEDILNKYNIPWHMGYCD